MTSNAELQAAWQAAEACQRRLLELCAPPAGQPLDRPALAAAARDLPPLWQALRRSMTELAQLQPAEAALRQQNEYLAALHETTLDLASQLDLGRLLENIVRRAGQLMGTDSGFLYLIAPGTDELRPQVGLGALAESLNRPVLPGDGLAGQVWASRRAVAVDDYDAWPGRADTFRRNAVRAAVGVPLISGERVVGVLGLAYSAASQRTFGPEAVEILNQFARLAVVAIGNARLYSNAQQELADRLRSEAALENRLFALTRPLADTSDLRFEDLFDVAEVQRIQDAFAHATGVSSIITRLDGSPITRGSNFCRLCEEIIRKTKKGLEACYASDAQLASPAQAEPTAQPCLSAGLWQSRASIDVGERPVAHWVIGQVLDEAADEVALLAYAREIGADEAEFRRALAEVPRMSRERFYQIGLALQLIARQLSRQALQNVQQARDITQRQQAAETLRASEARYRDLFENSPISLWEEDFSQVKAYLDDICRQGVTDLAAHLRANPAVANEALRRIRVLDVNQATVKLFGARTKEELLENMDRVLGAAVAYPWVVEELMAIHRGALEFEALSLNRKLTGETIEVALRWFIPAAQEQSLSRLIITLQDVTQPRRAEAALRASEARYRDLFELAPIAMSEQDFSEVKAYLDGLRRRGVTDLDAYLTANPAAVFEGMRRAKILDVNQVALKLYGARAKEQLLGPLDAVLAPETLPLLQAELLALERGATEFEGLGFNHRLSGERMEVALHWFTLGAGNEALARVLVTIQDVTQQRRAESELRVSEERYRVLAESLPDIVYILDREHRLRYINPTASRALRRPPESVVGFLQSELFPQSVAAFHDQDMDQVFATGETVTRESRLPLPDREIWIDSRLTPLRDASGEITAVLGISRDVTERKVMEQELRDERASLARRVAERTAELNAANAELVRAMRAKDDFLATMSHELRTPLTGILGLSESLQMGTYGEVNDKQARSLNMIHVSGEHLLALITDVLDLAKIGAEKLELQLEWLSAMEVCQASLRLIHPQATKKNIRVTFQTDQLVEALRADGRRFKQMLLNLLGNAVKFTPEGGAIGLEVRGDAAQQRALFTVWDTGIGISAADLQRLFQPFMQVDSSLSRRYEGAGLGLALVRRLAELHGGAVLAESREGQGSRFTIVLPWNPAERPRGDIEPGPAEAEPLAAQAASGTALPQAPGAVILLAEDNEVLTRTLADTLRARGCQVIAARDGLEALDLAWQYRPDLILMDIQMPGLDGLEAIRRMRADPALKATPVIALTALTMPGDRERCLAAGASDYMSKPIRWPELLQKMGALLRAR